MCIPALLEWPDRDNNVAPYTTDVGVGYPLIRLSSLGLEKPTRRILYFRCHA